MTDSVAYTISLKDAATIITENARFALEHNRDKIVPVLFSLPGMGKTEVIKNSMVDESGEPYDVEVIDMNTVSAGSLAMPMQDPETDAVKYYLHPQIKKVSEKALSPKNKNRPVFLALDELNRADENFTRPQLLNLLLSNTIADYTLPNNVFIVGMSNNADEEINGVVMSNDVTEFDSATTNRLMPLYIRLNAQDWLDYAYSVNELGETVVSPEISLYIESGADSGSTPDALLYQPSDPDAINKAFASPRSWTRLSSIIDNPVIRKNTALLAPAVAGQIGDAQATKFITWLKTHGTPLPILDILRDPSLYETHVTSNAEKIQFMMVAPNYIEANGFNRELADNFVQLYLDNHNTNIDLRWHTTYLNMRLFTKTPNFYKYLLAGESEITGEFMNIRTSVLVR